MNKDKFFKFFEIGKLDKGLFRIWIILSAAWLIFTSIAFLNNWEYKKIVELSDYKINCEAVYKKVPSWKKNEITGILEHDGFLTTSTIIYANKFNHDLHGTFGGLWFKSRSECVNHYKKIKSGKLADMMPGIIFYFMTPFLVALIYLFSKKGFLWIRQGFK